MTQESYFLNIFEKICRSNIYLFLISRYLIGKFLSKFIYDSDFKTVKFLEKNNLNDENHLKENLKKNLFKLLLIIWHPV